MAKRTQKTIYREGGQKILVVVTSRTSVGNLSGYKAVVTDNWGHELTIPAINKIWRSDAISHALSRFNEMMDKEVA